MKSKKMNLWKGICMVLLSTFSFIASAQTVDVQGSVVDAEGEPLIGVTVQVKGEAVGTITDADGHFTLFEVPSDATLEISYVGMRSQTIALNGRRSLQIVLEEDTELLEEVVVVGYGTMRREAVTGSVASVQGNTMREVAASNITQALQGRIAGVEMTQTSSKPGTSMQIRIRGTRSLNASNDPLVVLDGIPFAGSISDISPSDIKSVDILKDASATAIYGSRGANGVILVTTNKGYEGQKTTVSFNSYYGVKDAIKFPMMSGAEFAKLRATRGQYQNTLDESDETNTDWQDLLYRTGIVTSNDLGISGGMNKGSYSFGLGHYKDEAVLPGQEYERISLRVSLDKEIGKYFRLGLSSYSNYAVNDGSNLGLYNTLSASPLVNPYNEDGSWKRTILMPLDEQFLYSEEVVKDLIKNDKWIDRSKNFGTYNTITGEVKIPGIEGLKYTVNLGLNFRTGNGGAYRGKGVFNTNPLAASTASVSNSWTKNWVIENLLTYDRVFADKHRINVVGLYSAENTFYNRSRMYTTGITADHFQFYNLGQTDESITVDPEEQWYNKSGLMSYMGRVMYSYDDRYMITATLRSDGSSRLADGEKWHTYPAVSVGWNIDREGFMKDVSAVNQLKIRAGYGQTSNQSVDPYATMGRLATRPYNFGDETYSTGYYVSSLPNEALGWEYSETLNLGLDFSLFNNRLSGTAEYYVTNTNDILLRVGLPSTAGVGSYMANIGETENKGFELSLNGVIIDDLDGFTWEAGVNLYANRNKLVKLASGQERDEGNAWFVGYPIDVIYDYKYEGIWQVGDPYLDILEPGGNYGMIKVKYTGEYNEDGTPVRSIGLSDRIPQPLEPDFQGGFNTRLSYKGFDLNVVGAFKSGGKLISTLYSSAGYLNMLTGRRNNVKVDYWTLENYDARYPDPSGILSSDNPKYGSTLGYFDASYLKIRAITLGYNFENIAWLKDNGISRLRLYFTAQNPFVFFSPYHDESGMDPETNSYGDENVAVTETYQPRLLTIGTNTPTTKNYLFGINLTF